MLTFQGQFNFQFLISNKMTKKHFLSQLSDKKVTEILQDDHSKEKDFQKRFQFYHGRVVNRKKTEALLKASK